MPVFPQPIENSTEYEFGARPEIVYEPSDAVVALPVSPPGGVAVTQMPASAAPPSAAVTVPLIEPVVPSAAAGSAADSDPAPNANIAATATAIRTIRERFIGRSILSKLV